MISNIGFRNFRKFKDFPAIDLRGVTILVGENNSGKSTFTKASLLLANFLKMNLFPNVQAGKQEIGDTDYSKEFSFKDENFRHIYVDTFFQALCNKSDSGEIEFSCSIEDFEITVVMVPKNFKREKEEYVKNLDQCQKEAESNGEDAIYIFSESDFSIYYPQIRRELPNYYKQELDVDTAKVIKLKIYDNSNGFSIEIDYDLLKTIATMDGLNRNEKARLDELMVALSKLTPEDNAYDSVTEEIDELEKKRKEKEVQWWSGSLFVNKLNKHDNITPFIKSIAKGSFMQISRKLTAEEKLQYSNAGLDSMNRLTNLLNHNKEEYIYAHSVHQLSSYHFENGSQNDYVDKTISEYFINRTDKHDDRVRKWMSSFGIGDDFKIEKDLNGNLTIEIFDKDDIQSLSAKGIGSIQLMIMFFKLSMIVENDPEHTTVIIEEPEQNLHPALQSRLAELFHSIYCEYGCQFIVETHSEYLVRKSQVIVAENKNDKQNPFKVYYFVKDGLPYEIRYDQDGQFLDVFGTGFFDTAENLNLDLIQKHYGK